MLGNWLTWLWSLDKFKTCSSSANALRLVIQEERPRQSSLYGCLLENSLFFRGGQCSVLSRPLVDRTEAHLHYGGSYMLYSQSTDVDLIQKHCHRNILSNVWPHIWALTRNQLSEVERSMDGASCRDIQNHLLVTLKEQIHWKLITEYWILIFGLCGQSVFSEIFQILMQTDCPLGKSSK